MSNKIIAAVQMSSSPQVKENLVDMVRLVGEAASKGAGMVVLPECFALMVFTDAENLDVAEEQGSGQIQDALRQCAIDNKVWIVAGSVPLKTDDADRASIASLMYNDKGDIVARYNKIHLFDVEINSAVDDETDKNKATETYKESDTFKAGEDIIVVETPFGKIGMSICYDLRFPMLYSKMASQGAEIFLIPAAFTKATGEMHWDALIKARAIENQCYVIAAAQSGDHDNGRQTYGHSMMVDYLGKVCDIRLKGAGFITMNINLEAQKKVRKSFPVLEHKKL